jgi:trehalose 6-phosphate synthase/phosphatase
MLKALTALAADPKNYVFVISGRDQACLDDWLGHIPNLGLSAEHGSFIKYPDSNQWINLANEMDLSWMPKVAQVFQYFTERTQGSFIEHKRCAITWHYRLADPEYGSFQARECHNHLENAVLSKLPVEVMLGKKNLEVRPRQVNKGEIVKRLLGLRNQGCNSSGTSAGTGAGSGSGSGTGNGNGTDFVFCVGDDKTDEDMFQSLRRACYSQGQYGGSGGHGRTYSSMSRPVSMASYSGSFTESETADANMTVDTSSLLQPPGPSSVASPVGGLDFESCYTCTIGTSTKKTKASWHVNSPEQVIDLISIWADVDAVY